MGQDADGTTPLQSIDIDTRGTTPRGPVVEQAERSQSVTVIKREQIDSQFGMNMNDYLFSGIPGVSVSRRSNLGFMGGNSGFRIRGLKGERVNVFVDGIPSQVNNHFHPLVDQYTPDMIQRLEITRGASSVLHGSGSVGGVINIYTVEGPRQGNSGYIDVMYGRYNTKQLSARVSQGWGSGNLTVGTTARQTDGYRPNSEFQAQTYNFKLVQDINSYWTLGLRGGLTRADIENPGATFQSQPRLGKSTQDPENLALTLDRKSEGSKTLLALYGSQAVVKSLRNRFGVPTNFVRFTEPEYGFRGKQTWSEGKHNTLTVGLDAVYYSDDRTNNGVDYEENSAGYISPYAHFSYGFRNNTTLVDGGVRVTSTSDFGTDVSPEIGVVQFLDPTLALRARAGQAFRVPRINDAFKPFGIPNPDLEPERFNTAEIGLNKRFGNLAKFDVVGWWRGGDNLIQETGMGGTARSVNTGKFNHRGVEASLSVYPMDGLRFFVGAAYIDMGDETAEIPQQTYDFGFDYRIGKLLVGLTSRYAVELFGSNNSTNQLPDYYVADLHVEYFLRDDLSVYVNVDNITDEVYETQRGQPQVPRAAFFGIRKKWAIGGAEPTPSPRYRRRIY